MLIGFAYTSVLLFLAAICFTIGLSPVCIGRPVVFPLLSLTNSLLCVVVWFFGLMIVAGPIDYYGLLSVAAWSRIALELCVVILGLGIFWGKFKADLMRRYEEAVKGQVVFGADSESFRHVLGKAFTGLNLQFQELGTRVYLPDLTTELKIAVAPQLAATFLILFEDPKFNNVLRQICDGMLAAFSTTDRRVNLAPCLKLSALGLAFAVMALTTG